MVVISVASRCLKNLSAVDGLASRPHSYRRPAGSLLVFGIIGDEICALESRQFNPGLGNYCRILIQNVAWSKYQDGKRWFKKFVEK